MLIVKRDSDYIGVGSLIAAICRCVGSSSSLNMGNRVIMTLYKKILGKIILNLDLSRATSLTTVKVMKLFWLRHVTPVTRVTQIPADR